MMDERIIVPLLVTFDHVMDFLTFGWWSRVRGDQKVAHKSKVEVE